MANPQWLPGKQQNRAPRVISQTRRFKKTLKPLTELVEEVQSRFGRICDPATILLMVSAGLDPLYPDIVPDDPANPPPGYVTPSLDMRIDAAKAIINYVRPKLAQVEHVGDEERPIAFDTKVCEEISVNVEFRELAEQLIIGMASNPKLVPAANQVVDVNPYEVEEESDVSLIDPDKGLVNLEKDDA